MHGSYHHGDQFLSKKMKIKMLEQKLNHLREKTEDIEAYIAELKS